jgi:hypothetical protein
MTTYTHCVHCGKPKTIPQHVASRGSKPRKSAASAYVDRTIYEQDPYCSRICAEADLAEKETDDDVRVRMRPTGTDR